MLVLKPKIHETIWGNDFLSDMYCLDSDRIGHLYSCDPQQNGSTIMNGEYTGKTLYEYMQDNNYNDSLNFIIALVTPGQDLSIQVHPSTGMHKKNESWYFIKEPDMGFIYDGCLTSNKREIEEAMIEGRPQDVVDKLKIHSGDYVYVKGGTIHAMTAGSVVYEIEELNGVTYRLYDYDRLDQNGRKRDLQLETGLNAVNTHLKSDIIKNFRCTDEEKYSMQVIRENIHYNRSSKLECLTLIQGRSYLNDIKLGMSIVLEPNEKCNLGSGVYIAAF